MRTPPFAFRGTRSASERASFVRLFDLTSSSASRLALPILPLRTRADDLTLGGCRAGYPNPVQRITVINGFGYNGPNGPFEGARRRMAKRENVIRADAVLRDLESQLEIVIKATRIVGLMSRLGARATYCRLGRSFSRWKSQASRESVKFERAALKKVEMANASSMRCAISGGNHASSVLACSRRRARTSRCNK